MLLEAVHVLWGRVGMAGARVAALVVLARALGPSDLGRFSFLVVAWVVFTQMTSLGSEVAATVLTAEGREGGRRWLPALVGVSLLHALVSFGLFAGVRALFGARLFEGIPATAVDLLAASLLPGQVILVARGHLTGAKRFRAVSLLTLLHWGGYLAAVVLLHATGGLDLVRATLCFVVPAWGAALAGLALSRPPRRLPSGQDLREVLVLGVRSHLAQVLNFLQLRLDMIVLRVLASAEQLGWYSVATNLTEWLLYLPRALGTVAMPRSARGEEVDDRAFGWQFVLLAVGAVATAVLAPWLVDLFFGGDFRPAVPVIRVLLVGTVFLGHGTLAMGILFGRRDIGFLVRSGGVVVAAFLVLDLLLVPRWGAFGAALVSSLLYALYSFALVRRLFRGEPDRLRAAFLPVGGRGRA